MFYISKPPIIIRSHYLHAGDIRGDGETLNTSTPQPPHPIELCPAHVSLVRAHVFWPCLFLHRTMQHGSKWRSSEKEHAK
jgi:hypothetical protein